jgi:hypothetical protein
MQRVIRTSCFLFFVCVAGCGPRVGQVITIDRMTFMFHDQAALDEYAEVQHIAAAELKFMNANKERYTVLWRLSEVEVIRRVPNGYKAVIKRSTFVEPKAKENAEVFDIKDAIGEVGYIFSGNTPQREGEVTGLGGVIDPRK